MAVYKTPGVYIDEVSKFPSSIPAMETSIPIFIGYTQKAEYNGTSLLYKPTRISSLMEYINLFGTGFNAKFNVVEVPAGANDAVCTLNGKAMKMQINNNSSFYLYNALRLFFINGGGPSYILSVGSYGNASTDFNIDPSDFTGDGDTKPNIFDLLEKESEPAVIVLPDVIAMGAGAYPLYQLVLQHCAKMQNRFGIFDVYQSGSNTLQDDILQFRGNDSYPGIGNTALSYGAAYYPWLNTNITDQDEVDFTQLDATLDLGSLLPEQQAKTIAAEIKQLSIESLALQKEDKHRALMLCSPTYVNIIKAIRFIMNQLPASGAMAGAYRSIDNARGVWKAPANISLSGVNAPAMNISTIQQEDMNVDVNHGKSINCIREFTNKGTLVWGARTLDGNSNDWRYINVRRTILMIEESIKLACRAYVFEPNASATWITMQSMINNFLFNLWKQGALAGVKPEQAYFVRIGLGISMTANDILDGILRVSIGVAISRPAEFIEVTFQQQQQQS